jgi:hypothetical protein
VRTKTRTGAAGWFWTAILRPTGLPTPLLFSVTLARPNQLGSQVVWHHLDHHVRLTVPVLLCMQTILGPCLNTYAMSNAPQELGGRGLRASTQIRSSGVGRSIICAKSKDRSVCCSHRARIIGGLGSVQSRSDHQSVQQEKDGVVVSGGGENEYVRRWSVPVPGVQNRPNRLRPSTCQSGYTRFTLD